MQRFSLGRTHSTNQSGREFWLELMPICAMCWEKTSEAVYAQGAWQCEFSAYSFKCKAAERVKVLNWFVCDNVGGDGGSDDDDSDDAEDNNSGKQRNRNNNNVGLGHFYCSEYGRIANRSTRTGVLYSHTHTRAILLCFVVEFCFYYSFFPLFCAHRSKTQFVAL